jgi:hypothetical protein
MSVLRQRYERAVELARFLYLQRVAGFQPPGEPHLDAPTVEWLRQRLQSADLYLEYGCGGSTVLANTLGVPTVSVESDRFYAAVVRRVLLDPRLTNILTPAMGLTMEWGMPIIGRGRKGRRYVSAPLAALDGRFPDVILVDGRYRAACALASARAAYRFGCRSTLLFDDYEYRPHYHHVEEHLGVPTMVGRAAVFEIGRSEPPEDVVNRHEQDPR